MATISGLLIYIDEVPKNGLFSMIIEFYVLGTMFLQNKWYEGTSFLVSKLYDHAVPVFRLNPILASKFPKIGLFNMILPFSFLVCCVACSVI